MLKEPHIQQKQLCSMPSSLTQVAGVGVTHCVYFYFYYPPQHRTYTSGSLKTITGNILVIYKVSFLIIRKPPCQHVKIASRHIILKEH